MTRFFMSFLVQNLKELKVEFDDDVFHEVSLQKLNDLKVECDDEVFHELSCPKFKLFKSIM